MPSTITPVEAWTSPIQGPADNDVGLSATVNGAFQALADRVELLSHRVPAGRDGQVLRQHFIIADNPNNRFRLRGPVLNFGFGIQQIDVTDQGPIILIPQLPQKGEIKQIDFWLKGGDGSPQHAALPANLPAIAFHKSSMIAPASATQIGSTVTDAPANVAAYETAHALTIGGLSEVISADHRYYLVAFGESGANSVANALWFSGFTITVDRS